MCFRAILLTLLVAGLVQSNAGQSPTLAPTPPMGWNSWDSYGLAITEAQFLANVDVLTAKLKPFGWRYAVIDEGWYLQNPEVATRPAELKYTINSKGQYIPALNRFPSAGNDVGLKSIADRVHAAGLLFGLHIIRGIPKLAVEGNVDFGGFHAAEAADRSDTCPWNPDNFGVLDNAAGQAWYDGLIGQYASWGLDYLKVDCIASHPYKAAEIKMIHRAILKSGRPIVLSLSPGPTALDDAAEVGENAQLWRISDDVWDFWDRTDQPDFPRSVKRQFATIADWSRYTKPGNWPDADMLPVGELRPLPGYGKPRTSRLTPDEQQTLLTLWSISRSPLFMGGNLTQLDATTLALLTNAEVVAADQQGTGQRLAGQDGEVVAWTSKGANGVDYLALLNRGDSVSKIEAPFTQYGLKNGSYTVRDAWAKKDLGRLNQVSISIPPHGSIFLVLRP